MVRIKNLTSQSLSFPDLLAIQRLHVAPRAEMDVSVTAYQMLMRLYPEAIKRLPDAEDSGVVPDNVRLGPGEPVKPKRKRKKN